MKNFIFAMCGFLMMSLVSLCVQASSISESILSKSDVMVVDVGLPMIQNDTVIVSMDYWVLTVPRLAIMIAESPAIQSKTVVVPKCPFRYIYKSKYCTHYSNAVYSRLIIPY